MPQAPFLDDEALRIETLRDYAILDSEAEPVFDRITQYAAKQFGAETAIISLLDTDRQWFKSRCGLNATQTPRELAVCAYTVLEKCVNYIPDARLDPRTADNPLVTGAPHVRFYCGAPLIAPNGHVVGTLCLIDSHVRHDFSPTDQSLLQDMADMVVEQMELRKTARRVARETRNRVNAEAKTRLAESHLRAFVDTVPAAVALIAHDGTYLLRSGRWGALQRALIVPGDNDTDDFLDTISVRQDWVDAFDRAVSGETVTREEDILRLSDGTVKYAKWALQPWFGDSGEVKGVVLSITDITEQVSARLKAERQNELFNAVLENVEDGVVACDQDGRLTLFNRQTRTMHGLDATDVPIEACSDLYSLYEEDGTTPLAAERIPLFRALNGEAVSAQALVIAPDGLPRRDIVAQATQLRDRRGTVIGAVASMSDVTATKLATQKLIDSEARAMHIAFHDTLTGLGNRAQFTDLYGQGQALDGETPTVALFIDLNRFKLINDTMGHKIGDDLLVRVSGILRDTVGDAAYIARLGGDEFVCITQREDADQAMALAQTLIERLNTPISIAGQTLVTGAAIGVALSPIHGTTVKDLVRRADIAMYRAKVAGDGLPVLFEPVFELHTIERRRLEGELVQSVRNEELRVFFQPIVCGQDGSMQGVEALVRWEHPRLGLVAPDRFVPIAEDCGFIIELGDWVLEHAMAQFADVPGVFVSVNVSPVQFRDVQLVEKIQAALDRTGFDPGNLELEITESLLINDRALAHKVIGELKAKGIRIALDDFGTGYSSLSYIQQIPFNKVKIDRSFVQQIASSEPSQAVVRCVVELATALGMAVTAEGVETDQHEAMLKLIGCHTLQGFKYGRPVAFDDLSALFDLKRSVPALKLVVNS